MDMITKNMKFIFALIFCFTVVFASSFPKCKNCIYYKPQFYPYDLSSPFNRCMKFSDKHSITGESIFHYANLCRMNENQCGKQGKYFHQIHQKKHSSFHSFIAKITVYCYYLFSIITILISLIKMKNEQF